MEVFELSMGGNLEVAELGMGVGWRKSMFRTIQAGVSTEDLGASCDLGGGCLESKR